MTIIIIFLSLMAATAYLMRGRLRKGDKVYGFETKDNAGNSVIESDSSLQNLLLVQDYSIPGSGAASITIAYPGAVAQNMVAVSTATTHACEVLNGSILVKRVSSLSWTGDGQTGTLLLFTR